jgi:sn-glycerol 3-phosphate transport system permease protein
VGGVPPAGAVNFDLFAPLTLDNFVVAWAAPWLRYFLNTFLLVTASCRPVRGLHAGRLRLRALRVPGRDIAVHPRAAAAVHPARGADRRELRDRERLGMFDTVFGIGAALLASAFGIFLLRQAFKSVPRELEEAARIEGCSWMGVLLAGLCAAARPVYLAYALVSVSTHWNNFLWPLVVTNSESTRPLTVGLGSSPRPKAASTSRSSVPATMLSIAPLLIAFLLFQRQFVQAFLRAESA